MNCNVDYEELAQYAAGDAETERAREIEGHLSSCEACRHRLKALGEVDAGLRLLPRLEPRAAAVLQSRRLLSREVRGADAPEIMTLEEAADFLRVPRRAIGEIVEDLPAFEVAGEIRVRRSKLLEWIERRERASARSRAESQVSSILAAPL